MDLAAVPDVVGNAAHVVTILAALAVVALGPRRPVTYLLAALLLFFPLRDVSSVLDTWIADELWAYNAAVAWIGLVWSFAFLQLAFVARAVESPLTTPLRTRAANIVLVAGTVLAFVLPFVFHRSLILPAEEERWIWVDALVVASPFSYILPAIFSLVVAFDAFRRAPSGSLTRRRTGGYLAAFLLWDIGMLLGSAHFLMSKRFAEAAPGMIALEATFSCFFLAFPFVLARALLRDHLFDFDLKLKWTLRRGTLVGIFVAAFFVAAAIAEQWLSQYGVWFGGAAAGIMLFALRPLERAADRLADAAMPTVQPTPAYVAFRKVEVYKATVEDLARDGGISDADRRALDALRRKLGLSEEDAGAVERDAVGLSQ